MTPKYTPADGEPIDMSEFTLGERYGSEDMYRDMGIVPGSRVSVEKDGVIYTDTVREVTYRSPEWVPPVRPTGWRRIVRRLTPQRFRKPLPSSPPRPARVTVTIGESAEPLARHQRMLEEISKHVDKLTKP